MQTLTFTQKLLRQRSFLTSLIPLLALFLGLGATQTVSAQRYTASNLTISAAPTGGPATSTTYYIRPTTTTPQLNGAVLGGGTAFNQNAPNQGSLTLNAAAVAINSAGTTITPSFLYYRVYSVATGATVPNYTPVNLTLTSVDNTNSNPVTYALSNASIDLLNQPSVLGGGTYYVEVYFESTYNDNAGNTGTFRDPSTAARATFTVAPPTSTPAGGSTRWISIINTPAGTDWNNPANWSNGVPTRSANANIPGHGLNDKPLNTFAPLLDDPNANYEVQTLTLENADNNERAIVRIGRSVSSSTTTSATFIGATLRVYGDLNNLGGGILGAVSGNNGTANPALNSTLVFAGDANTFNIDASGNRVSTGGNQVIRGLTTVTDVRIEGTGIKGVINTLATPNTLTFSPTTTALLRTTFDNGQFARNTSKTAVVDLKDSGILFGERGDAFVDGITLADRTLQAGVKQAFGNIGLDVIPNRDIPSPNVVITRTIGAPFAGPVGTSMAIRRQYGVSGDVNNSTISTIIFHYFNTPFELNGNAEVNLTIFKTGNNGVPFQLVGGNYDGTMSITKAGVGSLNTLTLGDKNNPLPVTLTTFDAKRAGADALVTWETASELNNKGFNVQVSTNGKEFRTLGFVASASPNSVRATTYSYTDTEKNKTGLRYYRLMQVDTDGKTASFAPRAVSFDGKANSEGATAFAYPNPFTSDVTLSLPSKTEGQGQVIITDMTGRMVSQRPITVGAGNNDVPLSSLGDLKNGIYLMHVTLPSGETKNLKVVKQ